MRSPKRQSRYYKRKIFKNFQIFSTGRLLRIMQLRSGNIVEEMSNKKSEREIRAALRRQKKDRKNGLVEYDDFSSLNNQLNTLGLNLKQITGIELQEHVKPFFLHKW